MAVVFFCYGEDGVAKRVPSFARYVVVEAQFPRVLVLVFAQLVFDFLNKPRSPLTILKTFVHAVHVPTESFLRALVL